MTALIIVVVMVIVAGAVVIVANWAIAKTMSRLLAAMNDLPPHQNVTEIAQKTPISSLLIPTALTGLQRQGWVTSRQEPTRVGTLVASMDHATYTITDAGRERLERMARSSA